MFSKLLTLLRWRPRSRGETVVLLHGLGSVPGQLALLGWRLRMAGYRVVSPGYPSTREPIEALVERLDRVVRPLERGTVGRLHFVTHSLGGIVVRAYLDERDDPVDGRVVMLAPPNQGSELVDAFRRSPLLTRMLGPVGARLGTGQESIPRQLPAADFEVGVITGTRSVNPVGSYIIPGPNDGSVSVERARLDGARVQGHRGHAHVSDEPTRCSPLRDRVPVERPIRPHLRRRARWTFGQCS